MNAFIGKLSKTMHSFLEKPCENHQKLQKLQFLHPMNTPSPQLLSTILIIILIRILSRNRWQIGL